MQMHSGSGRDGTSSTDLIDSSSLSESLPPLSGTPSYCSSNTNFRATPPFENIVVGSEERWSCLRPVRRLQKIRAKRCLKENLQRELFERLSKWTFIGNANLAFATHQSLRMRLVHRLHLATGHLLRLSDHRTVRRPRIRFDDHTLDRTCRVTFGTHKHSAFSLQFVPIWRWLREIRTCGGREANRLVKEERRCQVHWNSLLL